MKRVLFNSGPVVHFAKEGSPYEELVYAVPKAIVIKDGLIESIMDSQDAIDEYSLHSNDQDNPTIRAYDLEGCAIVPGLIDAHTHLLWAGDRSREVAWKQEGKTYAQIASLGGGIRHTVHSTRSASEEQLQKLGYQRLREALSTGTTHLEAKSGYGLNVESELKLLNIAHQLGSINHLPSVDLTWMGAHDVPEGTTTDAYVDHLLSEQLPEVVDQGLARSADVFCEPGWFSVEQSEDILRASRSAGLSLRMHVDEFEDGGGGALAAELAVDTADHAYHTPLEVRLKMEEAGVVTGFLPGTPYAMGDDWPDMNRVKEESITYSFASDFNPNCRTLSLPFMCSLMVQRCGVHPLDALRAVTVNAAQTTPHPSGLVHGQIVEGGVANLNVVDGPHWEAVTQRPTGSPFSATVLNGQFITH